MKSGRATGVGFGAGVGVGVGVGVGLGVVFVALTSGGLGLGTGVPGTNVLPSSGGSSLVGELLVGGLSGVNSGGAFVSCSC